MKSLKSAEAHFDTRKLDSEQYTIGHLSNETAKLIARDLLLIGHLEESEILSGNDTSRYTAIVNKISGQACEVFFDLPGAPELDFSARGRGRKKSAEVSY